LLRVMLMPFTISPRKYLHYQFYLRHHYFLLSGLV
jgi:hypothetical protein